MPGLKIRFACLSLSNSLLKRFTFFNHCTSLNLNVAKAATDELCGDYWVGISFPIRKDVICACLHVALLPFSVLTKILHTRRETFTLVHCGYALAMDMMQNV